MDAEQPADNSPPASSSGAAMDIEQGQGHGQDSQEKPTTPTATPQAQELSGLGVSEVAPTSTLPDAPNPEPTASAATDGGVKSVPESAASDQPLGTAEEDVAMDVTETETQKVEEKPAQIHNPTTIVLEPSVPVTVEPLEPLAATEGPTSHPDNDAKRDVSMPPAQLNIDPVSVPSSKPPSPALTTRSYTEGQANERRLNVTDALSYLDAVKVQFQDQPDVYNHFLDIMKDFKSQLIDTPGVIRRVSHLFSGHLGLIQGFNTFLPAGYRIECSTDPQQSTMITVTTPSGTVLQSTRDEMPGPSSLQWSPFPRLEGPGGSGLDLGPPTTLSPDPSVYGAAMDSVSIEPAVQYVQKIKQRCDEATYRRFLEILGRYHNLADAVDEREVSAEIARLFKDDPDLRSDFRVFMPEKNQVPFDDADEGFLAAPSDARRTRSNTPLDRSTRRKPEVSLATAAEAATVPQKRKRRANEREREREREIAPKAGSAQRQQLQQQQQYAAASIAIPGLDETHFFDRVKRAINNRDAFNEFLRLVNLFTQELIDTARLVREARNFLGDGELMRQFMEILGWDDGRERERWMLEEQAAATGGRINTGLQLGSYRRMPPTLKVTCSGRDDMCKSVLNDEWISHPTWSSEDSGFITQKKNVYEEALHRSEEERHEYDFHIEAIVRTIAMLEPINNKIAQLTPEERGAFKLKPNLGGSGKSIHQRIIKKIYGREAGLDVLQAMQDTPAVAIPVEEWKRAQREWNKVWREVDARNYHKSRQARDEQMDKRASYIDPLFARTRPRHQLAYEMEDVGVLQDVIKISLSLLDRTQGQINVADRKKIETFLRSFVPLFFALDHEAFNRTVITQDMVDSEIADDGSSLADDLETASAASGSSSRTGGNRRKGGGVSSGGDLRKKLLKSEQAKSTSRKTRAQDGPSPAPSRPASPALSDAMPVDGVEEGKVEGEGSSQLRPASRKHVFFCNNIFLCAVAITRAPKSSGVNTPKDLKMSTLAQLVQLDERAAHAEHFYDLMLESCERLFDNEIDQHVFEEQMRYMFRFKDAYRIFTIDKVLGAFIKQVQLVLSNPRSHDLLEMLRRDRALSSPTTEDQTNSRRLAENIMGPDENLYRIDWTMTVQLLGKDDSRAYDAEILAERWQSYIESYVSGLPISRLRRPFLRRNLPPSATDATPDVIARGSLEIRVCVRTYRLFYVPHTEDYLSRIPSQADTSAAEQGMQKLKERQEVWMKKVASGEWLSPQANPERT
ncbi:hypothetical protein BU15DRAFT_88601 [Melanogaster broomeanus]|nr:hypothetical protein BU15DRAFT_88601 [Melanogaster broomeanus]